MPVAPGYKIQKESLTVHFVPGNPPHLAIRAQCQLTNVGNASLEFIGVTLPGEEEFGRASLRAEIDGKEIAPHHNPHEAAGDWRIPLPTPWRQKEKRNLSLWYDLAAQPASDPRIFVSATTFYLNDSGWFPALMGFKAFLSPAVVRPDPTDLSVIIPADFRVTASGQLSGTKKQNGEIESRFRIREADFDPYVLAGQYQQQIVSSSGVTIAIWTFKPIPADQAQKTAVQIAAAVNLDLQNFGRLPKSMDKILYVEFPKEAGNRQTNGHPGHASLLPGVINVDSEDMFALMDLAQTWFAHAIVPRPEAWALADGLEFYAVVVSSPGKNQVTNSQIGSVLADYDADKLKAVEKPIVSVTPNDPQAQIELMGNKVQLFFSALEDKCGQQNVTHAISDMVYALRGEEYGYSDFRAALEQQCHQDLGNFFHTWLAQPGIPPDFRARYENASGRKQ